MSGTHVVTLIMGWPRAQAQGLLGFAIERSIGGAKTWLPTTLRFAGQPTKAGALHPSNEAPIQSMVWNDPGLSDDRTSHGLPPDTALEYTVVPVRGTPEALVLDQASAVTVTLRTEPDVAPTGAAVWCNRGLSSSQEYERLFGEGHEPEGDEAAMSWLARGLDDAIVGFIEEAVQDPGAKLDVAAYHLDHPRVIAALAKLGKRCRISLDWGEEEGAISGPYEGPNGPAYKTLVAAGVEVHQRQHVAISHNKYMILGNAKGGAQAVLTGSTNFTRGGISTQSNHSVILRDPALAQAYLADFERVLRDDNVGLREADANGTTLGPNLEAYFSPHHGGDTPDLDRFAALAKEARSSIAFATFRMTAKEVVESILAHGSTRDDGVVVLGVTDRVYQGNAGSGDRLLHDEAFADDPRVVSAAKPLDDIEKEPEEQVLLTELKREGYEPLIHHKLLLVDWDTPQCVVVTGSANYSNNSSQNNDENSLVIQGDQRLAQQCFVEFARLYTHWRGRWLQERYPKHDHPEPTLAGDDGWTHGWYAGGRSTDLLRLGLGRDAWAELSAPAPVVSATRQALVERVAPRMKHVVVLMLENRSFDHMLGMLPGVDGVLGNDGRIDPRHYNYADPLVHDGERYTVAPAQFFDIPSEDHEADNGGPSHSFPAATEQLFGQKYRPASDAGSDPPTNNGFVKSYIAELRYAQKIADPKPEHVQVAMEAFTPEQLPTLNTLATEFCVCDRWFSEVPGPTEPNRLFTHAATSVGFAHNVWDQPIEARTIQENLAAQGHTWAFYYQDLSDSNQFPALKSQPDRVLTLPRFYADVQREDGLPTYSFLCPRYSDTDQEHANSQHAPQDVRYGEHLVADVYEALRRSPNWTNTLLIVTYDEHGGFYDHVLPPSEGVPNPDGLRSPTAYDEAQAKADPERNGYLLEDDYRFSFQRLGCRVPTVLISPWIAKGTVDSTTYQHTSIAATLKEVLGLPSFLTRRDASANPFTAALAGLDAPRTDAPLTLPRPPLPGQAAGEQAPAPGQAPPGALLRGVYSTLQHLDGHPDSGKPPPVPKTQAEASRYIEERYAAHDRYHRARKQGARFEVYRDKAGEYRWRLRDAAGTIIASSGEGMKTHAEVEAEIAAVRDLVPGAALVDA
ncbi:alkaline phosphatase family protein [Paraliomyxa miuraensis]|uniref:alkaline phosphatase family protein n=1 Tax=Paraliomyxa miuraensis TaxID=376150 RepID=UPI00224CC864|nr:alkaline phosphatase family protein [Paraliomyxa miuraensis]MCX4240391.1 phospholipase D-like domain-containing protein [Paraliomyxa miuraensis]